VRKHLGIEKWIVTGVSWGSTLALAYALEHPDRVLGIALVAVTTTSRDEVQWITEGVGRIFPEAGRSSRLRPAPGRANGSSRRTHGDDALLVTHYWSHDGFLAGGQAILARAAELDGIPGHLIHGRHDVSGPVFTPWQLHRRWSGSRLVVIEDEGHGGPKSMAALSEAVEEIAARRLGQKAL
jgi:proline iminopeptidase